MKKHLVWHQSGERLKLKWIKSSVKGGEGKVMFFWGVFCSRSWASYTATWQSVYQNLLQQHALPSLQASPNKPAIFMPDNVPISRQNGKF